MSRRLILSLPSPKSYCDCRTSCSQTTLDHVIPKSVLKRKLNKKKFRKANVDMHNLFPCCLRLNQQKGAKILDYDNFTISCEGNIGYLYRSCLYMNWKYNLEFPRDIVLKWKYKSILYPVRNFELVRNEEIKNKQGNDNIFLSHYFPITTLYQ